MIVDVGLTVVAISHKQVTPLTLMALGNLTVAIS